MISTEHPLQPRFDIPAVLDQPSFFSKPISNRSKIVELMSAQLTSVLGTTEISKFDPSQISNLLEARTEILVLATSLIGRHRLQIRSEVLKVSRVSP